MVERQEAWSSGSPCRAFLALPTSGTRLRGSEGVSGSSLQGVKHRGALADSPVHTWCLCWMLDTPSGPAWCLVAPGSGLRGSTFPWSSGVHLRTPGDRLQQDVGEGAVAAAPGEGWAAGET